MKIKHVYFALNEIERRICLLAIDDNYDEEKVEELLKLKFELLNCDLTDDYDISRIVETVNQ